MDWQLILALALVVPIVLFPVVFVFFLNFGGVYYAIKERKFNLLLSVTKILRIAVAILIPVAIYAVTVWFFYGNFSWQVALAVALVLPVVLIVPVLVWAAVVSGLYQVARDSLRRRATGRRIAVEEHVAR